MEESVTTDGGENRQASDAAGAWTIEGLAGGLSRRRFLRVAGGAALLPGLAGRARANSTPIDITFYEIGDPHFRAFDASSSNHNVTLRDNLQRMMTLTPSTPMPGAGTVGVPQGVINVGDLIEAGNETDPATGSAIGGLATREKQWENYVEAMGLLGNEPSSIVKFPVYEAYGNHDQDTFLKQVSDRIAARAALLPNLTAQSGSYTYVGGYGGITVSGVHFAWKWGPIHFVNCNIRVGDDAKRYPSSGSYSFLKNYLENTVGNSGEAVFVIVHLPPTTGAEGDWPLADRQAFYDLIRFYNIAGVLVGHVHSYAHYLWRGPSNDGPVGIPVYQCDAIQRGGLTQGIFNVFRILGDPNDPTKATVHMAQRIRNGTWGNVVSREISLSSNPAGPPPDPVDPNSLGVLEWRSINLHGGVACGLTLPQGELFVEPRAGGLRRIEVQFDEPIVVSSPGAALMVNGVSGSGPVTLAGLGIAVQVAVQDADTLVATFQQGGVAVALPDGMKWRLTLNVAVIGAAAGDSVASASVATTRLVGALVGDVDGNGRVTGRDLNRIHNTTAFDPAIIDCLRADVNGDANIGQIDADLAWANRVKRIDTLANPA